MQYLLGLLLLLSLAPADPPFAQERELLERRLAGLRQILPDGPNAQADVAYLKKMAASSGLGAADGLARPPSEAGTIGQITVDFTAMGRYAEIDRFFRQVALSPRLIDVVSLSLTASPEDVVLLKAVMRLPFRPLHAPLTQLPDGVHRPQGVPRSVGDEYLRHQALAISKTEAIVRWRRIRRNPRLFLAELGAIISDRPASLTEASLGEEFRVRGVALGEATVKAIERRAERGFFRVSDFVAAKQGACDHFEIRGTSPVAGPDAELTVVADDPFVQDDAPCRVDRDPARALNLGTIKGKVTGSRSITLRLRDVDATDVFQVLALGTGQAFLVDDDVLGRVSGELVRVDMDHVLKALGGLGWSIEQEGRVRRISLASHGRTHGKKATDTARLPVANGSTTLMLKRAELRDVFAAMAEVDPSLAALGPQGSFGRASLWAPEVPVADVWAACVSAAGLVERREEGRVLLERNPGSGDVLVPVAAAATDAPRLVLRPADLSSAEVDLVALINVGEGRPWMAFAYTPTGNLVGYRPGDRVADGVVRSVDSTDILIEGEDGGVHAYFVSP